MTVDLVALCIDANDPDLLARFWSGMLGWSVGHDGASLAPTDGTGLALRFVASHHHKSRQNLVHLHLTSDSLEDQQQIVERALELGAQHIDVGQLPEEGHVVLADLEGNEFCVIEPGNQFLAGCGFLAELACDGSRDVGLFWSEALGWPLGWDQDQETSIRSPAGGPKVSWGGPPLMDADGTTSFRFEIATDGDPEVEIDRLVALGARPVRTDRTTGQTVMTDPDGNEFLLLPAGDHEPFVPADFTPPTQLDHPDFRLRPLGPEHNLRDHAAWMGSIDHIRATPGFPDGRWPRPMSLEENLEDLQRHRDHFRDRVGFTYTVLEAGGPVDEADVIGCVYIYPEDEAETDVHVQSWVRVERTELDEPLATTVRAWLEDAWPWSPERIRDHPRSPTH